MPKYEKKNREILKFAPDEPTQLTLDTDPSSAKGNTRYTQWGQKTSFTYFTKEGYVFFASEALHNKLQQYSKGDAVIITLVDGKVWTVTVSGERQIANSNIQKKVDDTETLILLRAIYEDTQTIRNNLNGNAKTQVQVGATAQERKYPTDDPTGDTEGDLPF